LAKNDEGEFELVLGNRQLISVFLIVVILLGVFFSMGYLVGRSSAPIPQVDTARNGGSTKPIVVEHPSSGGASPAATPTQDAAPASTEAKSPPADTASTHPAQTAPSPAPAPVREEKPAASAPASVTGEPPAGEYWQVVATTRPDAEIIAEALTKKGFKAIVAPAPKENLFRVLVGPLKDSAGQTRTNLEAAGFKNPLMRKY